MVVGARRGQSSLIVVDLAYPMRWYEKVYRKGLAQVGGLFILDLVEELDDRRLVYWRAGRVLAVVFAYALLLPNRNVAVGSWIGRTCPGNTVS